MGYYTYYRLGVKNEDKVPLERQREASLYLAELFDCNEKEKNLILEADYPFGWISYDSMKWYDWERDMTNVSERFPEIEFILYGEGEERDDTWRAFFKSGKCIYQHAYIYYDPEPNSEDFED